MAYSVLLLLLVILAVPAALICIALGIYLARRKMNGNKPTPTQDLSPSQADEITSTWNLLNH
jgi:hypothetical protein